MRILWTDGINRIKKSQAEELCESSSCIWRQFQNEDLAYKTPPLGEGVNRRIAVVVIVQEPMVNWDLQIRSTDLFLLKITILQSLAAMWKGFQEAEYCSYLHTSPQWLNISLLKYEFKTLSHNFWRCLSAMEKRKEKID